MKEYDGSKTKEILIELVQQDIRMIFVFVLTYDITIYKGSSRF